MKKIILAIMAILFFSVPVYAEEGPCKVKGAPCYTKSGIIVLRERPSFDSKIVYSSTPAKKDSKIFYYLKSISLSEGKNWGYFKSMMPTMDGATGKFFQEEGWMLLDETFHEVDLENMKVILFKSPKENVSILPYKPDKHVVFIATEQLRIFFPLDEATIEFKEK